MPTNAGLSQTELMQTKMLAVTDIRRIYGIPRPTIYLWVKQGRFPKQYKLGPRKSAWLASDVEAWLLSKRAA
jgi:prophage regulatory protein